MSLPNHVIADTTNRSTVAGRLRLNQLVMIAIMAVFAVLLAFSTYRSISLRLDLEREAIIDQLRRDIGVLVRQAELEFSSNATLLREELALITSDSRISVAVLMDHTGTVLMAKDYAWAKKSASSVLTPQQLALVGEARNTRRLLTSYDWEDGNSVFLAMSFLVPGHQAQLRAIDRGVIFVVCNLDAVRQEAFREALRTAALDTLLLTLLLLPLLRILHNLVTRPLRDIVNYSKQEQGAAQIEPLALTQAPRDLHELADSISGMRASLHRQLLELREKSELNAVILDNTDDGFITITPKGIIVSVSRPVTSIFGYDSHEMLGANVSMLMPSPDREHHDDYLARYRNSPHAPRITSLGRRREVQGRRKDGSLFPMELRVERVVRNGEEFFVGSVRDITERSKLEQAKNEFVSIVSHELRTPLTAINGSLGLILGTVRAQLTPTLLNLIEIAHRNGLRLLSLINDLLDMEKLMAGKMALNCTSHAITPLVRYSVELLTPYSREMQVQMILESGTDAIVRVDADRLQQALSNLLSNAIKFSPPGGTVTVSTREENGRVRISIRDEGQGIPESFRARVFEKFAQADSTDNRQKGGTGLGLAITRELIERMGGSIGYQSEVGKGTEFHVEFAAQATDTSDVSAT